MSSTDRRKHWRNKNKAKAYASQRRWQAKNPERWKALQREGAARRRKANPDRFRDQYLLRTYGISLADYYALFAKQDKRCATCRVASVGRGGWHVDHCHRTGKVRGILCRRCNTIAGQAADNASVLRMIANYLDENF